MVDVDLLRGSGGMLFVDSIVHTTLYIGLSGVGYLERHK